MAYKPQYTYELWRGGELKANLVHINSISWGYGYLKFPSAKFTYLTKDLDDELSANLIAGSELRISRKGNNDTDTKLVYAGEIQKVTNGEDKDGNRTLNINVKAWGEVFLSSRLVTTTFTSVEESEIVKGIIDYIQNPASYGGSYTTDQVDWGISDGVYEITDNVRVRQYQEDVALKILQQISEVEDIGGNPQRLRGFRMTPDLMDSRYHVFNYYAEYGEDKSDSVIYTSPAIASINQISDITSLVNRVEGIGKNGIRQTGEYLDSSHLDFYKLRQKLVNFSNITTNATLLEKVDEYVNKAVIPVTVYNIQTIPNDPFVGQYRCGDVIKLQYNSDRISVDSTFRVYGIDISVDNNGIEITNIQIAEEFVFDTVTEGYAKLVTAVVDNQENLVDSTK